MIPSPFPVARTSYYAYNVFIELTSGTSLYMSPAEQPVSPLIAPLSRTSRMTLLDSLVAVLSPPVFPGDELRTLRAYFLNVILLLKIATQLLAPFLWSGTIERRAFMAVVWLAMAF